MKVSDATILMIGDRAPLDDGHWLARWAGRLSTAIQVPDHPSNDPLPDLITGAQSPVIAVAYRDGVERLIRHAGTADGEPGVRGAFLVAPPSGTPLEDRVDPLPFPSVLVASRDDPDCEFDRAEEMGARWGSHVVDAGEAGRLDGASGRGPWPEGLMVFAKFLSNLPRD